MNKHYISSRVWEVLLLVSIVFTLFAVNTTLTLAEDVPQADAVVVTSDVVTVTTDGVTNEGTTEGAVFVPAVEEGELIVDTFSEESVAPEEIPVVESTEAPPVPAEVTTDVVTDAVAESTTPQNPELTTDKDDYHPGETATIFGRFFAPLQNFVLKIFGFSFFNGDSTYESTFSTDESGSFDHSYELEDVYRPDYLVQAFDTDGTLITQKTFTDAAGASVNVEQCDNGGIGATPVSCDNPGNPNNHWGTGNVNGSKAHWQEGDFLPYRAIVVAPNTGVQQVTFSFDTAKSSESKHAIDYLSSYDLTESTGAASLNHANLIDPCRDIIGTCNPGAPNATAAIPVPTSLTTAYPAACAAGSFGGSPTTGFLKAWVPAGITISGLTVTQNAPASTGDCEASFRIDFSLSAPATVVLAWGGHVASSENPGAGGYWGTGNSVPTGSPYHMHAGFAPQYSGALPPTCGTSIPKNQCEFNVGSQDLQLASSAIVLAAPEGTIIVEKQTLPGGDSQSFTFNPSWSTQDFNLSDNQSTTTTQIPGTYNVSETVPAGWTQTSAVCTSSLGDQETIGAIDLNADETVTCVFTNTKKGHIIVDKVTNPAADSQSFAFTTGGTGYTGFSLTDAASPNNQEVVPGAYSVSEGVVAGWVSDGGVCNQDETPASLDVAPGETVTCTFTNTKQSTLTVNKVLTPSNDGGKFNLRIDGQTAGTGGNVGNGGTTGAQVVTVGAHTVSETAGTDTTLSDYTGVISGACASDGSVTLAAGENKVCTITNTRNTGKIELQKDFVGTPESVTIKIGTAQNGIQVDTDVLAADGTDGEHTVNTGTYFVSETLTTPAKYTSALACYNDVNHNNAVDNGDTAHTVDTNTGEVSVGNNDDVLCVYTNTRNTGTVLIKKVMIGGTDTFAFTGTPNGSISVDGGTIQTAVDTGAYVGTESAKAGWDLTSVVCDDQNSTGDINARTASFNVESGETVTCTFTNTKRGSITIEKQTLPDADSASFTFTGDVSGSLSDGQTATQSVVPGTYTSTEAAKAGWDLTAISCDDQDSGGVIGTGVATFNVAAGENVKCTFTNTKRGHVIILKNAIPDSNTQAFNFNNNFGNGNSATFNLTDTTAAGLPSLDAEVLPGKYAVSEDAVTGWQLASATCDQGETVADIDVAAGETVTCTFTNEKLAKITLVKNTVGGNGSFDFVMTGTGLPANDTLTTVANTDSEVYSNLNPDNTYSIAETVPAGWDLTSTVCSNGDLITAITPNAGEEITCTFTNTKRGHIIVDKVTNPAGDAQSFSFTTNAGSNFALTDAAAPHDSGAVVPSTYSVAETVPAGWAQTSATCDDGSPVDAIALGAGETVTCTFVNNKPAAQIDLTPLTATNKIGDNHVITANVQVQNGNGTWGPAANGTLVSFSITNSNGATAAFVGGNTCTTTAGACSITINSSTSGSVAVHASSTPTVLGVALNVQSGTGGDNSADAAKTYVNAKISITPPSSTNEINDDHDYIVKVEADNGDGTGFNPVNGAIANAIVSPATSLNVSDCNDGTNASGECTVTVNSAVAGVFTITARSTIMVGGLEFKLQTNGLGANSGPATKTFVDAKISIGQSGVNEIGNPHTFTGHVDVNSGSGFVNAPDGTTINFSLSGTGALSASSCLTTGGTGSCSVTDTSSVVGVDIVNASTSVTVGGVSLLRSTSGSAGNSGPATKKWVDAYITIGESATNNITDDHVFTITVTQVPSSATPAATASITPSVTPTPDVESTTCGPSVHFVGNVATCTFTINNNTPGVFTADATAVLTVGGVVLTRTTDGVGQNSDSAIKTYVAGSLDVTKALVLGGYALPVNGSFTVSVDGPSYPAPSSSTTLIFTVTNGVVSGVQTLNNLIPGTYHVIENNPGVAWTATGGGNVTVVANETAHSVVTNTLKQPHTTISITANTQEATIGGNVVLTISDTNDGAVPLYNNSVAFNYNGVTTTLDKTSPNFSGDTNNDGIMDVGETWTWIVTVTITADTTFTVAGHGFDPLGNDITPTTGYITEAGSIVIRVIGTTRTLGFWQTHTNFTSSIFATSSMQKFVGSGTHRGAITNVLLPAQSQLFGGFYAPIAKTTTGTKRTVVDQARIQMLQQLLAAKLNCAAFGCSGATLTLIANADAAYAAGANKATIISLAGQLDTFNNSGDAFAIPVALGATGKATPKVSQSYANLVFWNLP